MAVLKFHLLDIAVERDARCKVNDCLALQEVGGTTMSFVKTTDSDSISASLSLMCVVFSVGSRRCPSWRRPPPGTKLLAITLGANIEHASNWIFDLAIDPTFSGGR